MNEITPLKILFVEDILSDYELAEINLTNSDINMESRRVEKKEEYLKQLIEFKPDLIISDYSLPAFNGMQALKILLEYDSAIPFIVLTGTMNEEIAVKCMKAGATDYVLKEHIGKLSFAVKEAIRHREMLIEKNTAEEALLESESRYRSIFENNHAVMLLINPDDGIIRDANPAASAFYGYRKDDLIGKSIISMSLLEGTLAMERLVACAGGRENHFYSRHLMSDGTPRDVEIFIGPVKYRGHTLLYSRYH